MSFSKYNADPERAEAMREAFHRVCGVLHLDGNAQDPLTELVVLKIIELAKAEDLDPERLCIDVLAELGETSWEQPDRISDGAGRLS
jgi:hypothetical protein